MFSFHPHPVLLSSVECIWKVCALHSKKKLLFDSFPKAPGFFFFFVNLMVKPNTGRPESKAPHLALRHLQWHGETANVTAAKQEGSVIVKRLIK